MICKWCGATVTVGEPKCSRCKNQLPAISDCGGFYDLVPNAKRVGSGQIPSREFTANIESNSSKTISSAEKKVSSPSNSTTATRRNGFITQICISIVGLILVLAFLMMLNNKIENNNEMLNNLDTKTAALHSEFSLFKEASVLQEETDTTPDTEEIVPPERQLQEDHISIDIDITHSSKGPVIVTSSDLCTYSDMIVAQSTFHNNHQSLSSVIIGIDNEQSCVDIEIENSSFDLEKGVGILSTYCYVDESIFGKQQGDEEYYWEFQINSNDEWNSFDSSIFISAGNDRNITYRINELLQLLDESEMVNFRLIYKRFNTEGGSLTVTLSGITIPREVLETNAINTEIETQEDSSNE